MASASQINANRENAKKSSGPKTAEGKQTSSLNALKHGLCSNGDFYLLEDEDQDKFAALCQTFIKDRTTVKRNRTHSRPPLSRTPMAHHPRHAFQNHCFSANRHILATGAFSVYLRYQAQHERAFYKALKELRTIRELKLKHHIGFESQKQKAHAHNLRQLIDLEKLRLLKSQASPKQTPSSAPIPPETSPGGPPKAA